MTPPESPSPPVVRVPFGDAAVTLDYSARPASVRWSGPGDGPRPMFYAFWFAWYATHAGDPGTVEDPLALVRSGAAAP